MIQEIFSVSFISRSFIGIQINNHHTLYQYVTERHPKSKISSFPIESILSMRLSRNNTIFTEVGQWRTTDEPDLLLISCRLLLLLPALTFSHAYCCSNTVPSFHWLPLHMLLHSIFVLLSLPCFTVHGALSSRGTSLHSFPGSKWKVIVLDHKN